MGIRGNFLKHGGKESKGENSILKGLKKGHGFAISRNGVWSGEKKIR